MAGQNILSDKKWPTVDVFFFFFYLSAGFIIKNSFILQTHLRRLCELDKVPRKNFQRFKKYTLFSMDTNPF